MGRPARVKSIDALQSMSAALECFHDHVRSALDDLEMEINRALQWIGQDCRQYWKQEVRRAWDNVTEAKLQLEHALIFRRGERQHSACMEEKKALERAKRYLELAQSKEQAIGHWALAIERAVHEYRGIRTNLVDWLDADFPRAVAVLGRMISNLESYIRLEAPADDLAPIIGLATASPADAQAADTSQNANEKTGEEKLKTELPPASEPEKK